MELLDLTEQDKELVQEAIKASDRLYVRDASEVAAAIRTASGHVFSAIHFEARVGFATVCGEIAAICCMIAGGHRDLNTVVAVWRNPHGEHFLLPPCGRCREVIRQFNPDAWIIISSKEDYWAKDAIESPRKVRAADLLPHPY